MKLNLTTIMLLSVLSSFISCSTFVGHVSVPCFRKLLTEDASALLLYLVRILYQLTLASTWEEIVSMHIARLVLKLLRSV